MSQALRGFALTQSCDMGRAEPALRDALADAERAPGPFCEAACNAAGFLSAVLYEVNDIAGEHSLLEPRFDVIERVTLPDALITAAVVRCRLRRLEGNPLEALEGLDRALGFPLIERVCTDLQMDNGAAARKTLHALARRWCLRPSTTTVARWPRRDRSSVHGLRAVLWARVGQRDRALT